MRRSSGNERRRSSQSRCPTAVYTATFKDIRGLYLDENCLTIEVPTKFIRERIDQRYRELILAALADVGNDSLGLEIRIEDELDLSVRRPRRRRSSTSPARASDSGALPTATEAVAPTRDRPSNINPKYTFDSFVTGPVQPLRPGRGAVGRRDPGPGLQPAVRLRRGRPGQDPPPAGHRPVRAARTTRATGSATSRPRRCSTSSSTPSATTPSPSSSAATARSTCSSSTTCSSWRARSSSRRSSSTPSTRSTRPTARSC